MHPFNRAWLDARGEGANFYDGQPLGDRTQTCVISHVLTYSHFAHSEFFDLAAYSHLTLFHTAALAFTAIYLTSFSTLSWLYCSLGLFCHGCLFKKI